jgi:hypothetical protein
LRLPKAWRTVSKIPEIALCSVQGHERMYLELGDCLELDLLNLVVCEHLVDYDHLGLCRQHLHLGGKSFSFFVLLSKIIYETEASGHCYAKGLI